MERKFKIGDLLKFKPSSEVFTALPATAGLVLVTKEIPDNSRFFYGRVCFDGKEHLWSYDQFYLVSDADSKKNF